uniref:Signal sequence receptor subunit 2 n=2 Tax=Capra hircus TaxID=9925 RepID=A0A8C2NHU4_CAPHI
MCTMRLLAFAVLALFAVTQAEEGARLLASKSLLNRYAVEGRDLTLQYNIYNVGSSAALDVELSDDSFPPEDFGIVSGMLNVKWDRIAPHKLRGSAATLEQSCLPCAPNSWPALQDEGMWGKLGPSSDWLYQCTWAGRNPGSAGV